MNFIELKNIFQPRSNPQKTYVKSLQKLKFKEILVYQFIFYKSTS